ncbi:MAG: hypothetical protein ACRDJU_03870, partial [Actinomycetota bacterium]
AHSGDHQGYLGLAREIREDLDRIVADTSASPALIGQLLDEIPTRERIATIKEVFAKLPAEQQWAILEKAFGDAQIAQALAEERVARLDERQRNAGRQQVARAARSENRLDTRQVAENDRLTLGLYREADVHAAVARGHRSTAAARRVVLRRGPDAGVFQVVEDAFSPDGGYFVTAEYDRQTWQADRLPAHAPIRIGSINPTSQGPEFEPVLYPGGRFDVEVAGELHQGLLHLGYVLLGDEDVFAAPQAAGNGATKGVGR